MSKNTIVKVMRESPSLPIRTFLKKQRVNVLFCLAAFFSAASIAQTSDSLTVVYGQVDASRFPVIVSYVTVTDDTGGTISGLTEANFVVQEDSVVESPILVEDLTGLGRGISVVLVMDRSGSMEEELEDAQSAASMFVDLLSEDDQAALVTFSDEATIDHNFSRDKDSLKDKIDDIKAKGSTAIFDAALVAADLLQDVTGRKAIILLTDGKDKKSNATADDVVWRATSEGVPIFAIGLGDEVEEEELRRMAESSGGQYYFSPMSSDLKEIYRAIAVLLRQRYRIQYTTHNPTTDGTTRVVSIRAEQAGLAGAASNTYNAPYNVPTITPLAQDIPRPAGDLRIQIAVPASSQKMYNLHNLRIVLKYDATYLQVKAPFENNLRPLSFFGDPTDFVFMTRVDDKNNKVILRFNRKGNRAPAEGRGAIAEITFRVNENILYDTPLDFNLINVSASDKNNWPVAVQTSDLNLTNNNIVVWPGDTNFNGVVELSDVNVLGLYWSLSGPPRADATDPNMWMPQLAGRYPSPPVAHADANGNGMVEERDLFPIGLNWRKTRSDYGAPKPASPEPAPDGNVDFVLTKDAETNHAVLAVSLQNGNRSRLAGMSFHLRYPPGIQIVSAKSGEGWASAPLVIQQDEKEQRRLAMGLMIPNGEMTAAANGNLVEIKLTGDLDAAHQAFSLENVAVVSPGGQMRELAVSTRQTTEQESGPNDFALNPAFPNPFSIAPGRSQTTRLQFKTPPAAEVSISVYSITGQHVRTLRNGQVDAGLKSVSWDGTDDQSRNVAAGIYLIKMTARTSQGERFSKTQKISLVR